MGNLFLSIGVFLKNHTINKWLFDGLDLVLPWFQISILLSLFLQADTCFLFLISVFEKKIELLNYTQT